MDLLIPDLGATEVWRKKAAKIPILRKCAVWEGLEEIAMAEEKKRVGFWG